MKRHTRLATSGGSTPRLEGHKVLAILNFAVLARHSDNTSSDSFNSVNSIKSVDMFFLDQVALKFRSKRRGGNLSRDSGGDILLALVLIVIGS